MNQNSSLIQVTIHTFIVFLVILFISAVEPITDWVISYVHTIPIL